MDHPVTAVYGANVLYPAPRDLFVRLVQAGLLRARWTDAIHGEWVRNVLKNNPALSPDRLARTQGLMNAAVRDCLVTGSEDLIESLSLPDPDDRHVLAAVRAAAAEVIVTFNLKDFPAAELGRFGVAAMHPDDFLSDLSAADLYAIANDPANLAKVMSPGEVPPDAEFVWGTLRAACRGVPGVARMRGLVRRHPGGDVLGYVTEYAAGPDLNDFTFADPAEAARAAAGVAATYAELAERDTDQGGAHYCNQIVTGCPGRRALTLIDVDSFSFGDRRRPDGMLAPRHYQNHGAGFGPPEHNTGATIAHGPETAAYLLAEIVRRILKHRHPAVVATTAGDALPLLDSVRGN